MRKLFYSMLCLGVVGARGPLPIPEIVIRRFQLLQNSWEAYNKIIELVSIIREEKSTHRDKLVETNKIRQQICQYRDDTREILIKEIEKLKRKLEQGVTDPSDEESMRKSICILEQDLVDNPPISEEFQPNNEEVDEVNNEISALGEKIAFCERKRQEIKEILTMYLEILPPGAPR